MRPGGRSMCHRAAVYGFVREPDEAAATDEDDAAAVDEEAPDVVPMFPVPPAD